MNRTKIYYLTLLFLATVTACQSFPATTIPQPIETEINAGSIQTPTSVTPDILISPTMSNSAMGPSVRLAWFYKPPENEPLSTLSRNFDFYILTHRDEAERDQLRTLGVDKTIHQYLLFVQIMDPGSCDERPYGNQVAYQIGDFCRIQQEHPDWFLRDREGNIIRKGDNVYMDAGNLEYRQFWLERAQQMQAEFGWDGIFIDNVEASLDKLKRLDSPPANYKDNAEYQTAIEGFLKYLYDGFFKPQNVSVMANIIELKDKDIWFRYMQYLDGAMIEAFSVDYNNRYLIFNEWQRQIDIAIQTQALGKSVILVAQGEADDQAREEFALASYLLVNDGNAFFRYTNSDNYEKVWLYDNYSIDLGAPLDTAYREGIITWRRDFEKGSVTINPFTHKTEFILYR
jgi:hypothetical protein